MTTLDFLLHMTPATVTLGRISLDACANLRAAMVYVHYLLT